MLLVAVPVVTVDVDVAVLVAELEVVGILVVVIFTVDVVLVVVVFVCAEIKVHRARMFARIEKYCMVTEVWRDGEGSERIFYPLIGESVNILQNTGLRWASCIAMELLTVGRIELASDLTDLRSRTDESLPRHPQGAPRISWWYHDVLR